MIEHPSRAIKYFLTTVKGPGRFNCKINQQNTSGACDRCHPLAASASSVPAAATSVRKKANPN